MKLSSELDKIIRQNVKDDSAYQVIHHMIALELDDDALHHDYLQQLHKIMTARYDNLDDMFEAYLKMGCVTLDMSGGNINRIEDQAYYTLAQFPERPIAAQGTPLSQTLCHRVTVEKETITLHHISGMNPPLEDHIKTHHTESYIGTPIYVDDALWGTICFFSAEAREQPFDTREIEFAELMALGISNALNSHLTQQQKRQAQQRYRLIFENIDIPVLIYDVETYEIFDVNRTATQFYGYSREEFLELTMLDINMMPQSDIEAYIADSRETGLPYTRFPHRLKLGDIRDVEEYSNEMMIENRRLRFSLIYDFSERHAAEEALKHSEANLRAIFDNASQLMFLVDNTGAIIAMNRAATQMTFIIDGTRGEISSNTTIHKYHPKSDRYLVSDYINRALEGHTTDHDALLKLDDTQSLYINYRYVPVKTPDNQIIGVCVTGQDVTSLKLSEQKLAYERNILRTLIDNLPDAIYIKDENARLLTANQRYLDWVHVNSTDEILGKTDADLHQDYGEQYYADDLSVLNTGGILNKDEQVILPDDSEGIFATTRIPLQNDGHIVGLVGVGRDITKQRAIEQGLRDNEEKFHQLVTHIPEAFWIFDIDSQRLIYTSENYESMFGISAEERQRDLEQYLEQVHPDDRDNVREGLKRQSQGLETNYDVRFINDKQAGIRWVNIRVYPVLDQDGEVYRVAGVAVDVTEEKRAQETILEMRTQEERINILSTFFRDASHEFRTPLSVINTSLYVMEKTDDVEKRHTHVGLIREQVRGISELVEMLVLMSRLDSGAELTMSVTNANTILSQFNQTFADIYPERADDFKVTLRQSLPPILGNRNYIKQAIRNLIDNAVRYSESGTPIAIRSYHDNGNVVIEVEDRGIGISDAEMNKIFRRFYRGDEAHSTRGFGLGLPIAQSIVYRHGGDIKVESKVGAGSRFRLFLPMLKVLRD